MRSLSVWTWAFVLFVFALLAIEGCATSRSAGQQVSDATITTTVKSKLAADPETNPFEIDVDTNSGVVRLSGFVDEKGDREEAEELARDTDGVKRVINDIQVGDKTLEETVDDTTITGRVKTNLTRGTGLDAFNIDVDTEQGVVTLYGLVESEDEREQAEELARNTEGVKEVRNLIEVEARTID